MMLLFDWKVLAVAVEVNVELAWGERGVEVAEVDRRASWRGWRESIRRSGHGEGDEHVPLDGGWEDAEAAIINVLPTAWWVSKGASMGHEMGKEWGSPRQ